MTTDKSVFIPVDPDTAFALITRPERLRRWQAVAARVDLRVGGEYRWTITPEQSAAGTFTEIEPGKRVVFTWDWEGSTAPAAAASKVTITLAASTAGPTSASSTRASVSKPQPATPRGGTTTSDAWPHWPLRQGPGRRHRRPAGCCTGGPSRGRRPAHARSVPGPRPGGNHRHGLRGTAGLHGGQHP